MLDEAIFLASCKKKFTCTTPFCNCNCCVASCKKSRTTLYFSQRCETSCLRVTSPQQLATQFSQNGPIRAQLSQDVSDLARSPSCLLLYASQVAKKVANVWHPLCNLKGFSFAIVALQVARKIASCNMALIRLSEPLIFHLLIRTIHAHLELDIFQFKSWSWEGTKRLDDLKKKKRFLIFNYCAEPRVRILNP